MSRADRAFWIGAMKATGFVVLVVAIVWFGNYVRACQIEAAVERILEKLREQQLEQRK
jgi:hypothetical protein